jgi:hypothetical protein
MSEDKKFAVDAKAKMLEALRKKQKGNTTGKSAGPNLVQNLVLVKLAGCAKDAPT